MRGPLDYTSHVGLIPQVPGKLKGLVSATWTQAGMAPALFSPPELGIFPFMCFLPIDHMGPSDLPATGDKRLLPYVSTFIPGL